MFALGSNYARDRKKLTLYFCADKRIDFRGILKID
jgi:cell fate regulator YaaT (PSP1 superfamily)